MSFVRNADASLEAWRILASGTERPRLYGAVPRAGLSLQEKEPMSLRFLLFLPAGLLFSQQASFDVASVKPTTHKRDANGFSQNEDPQIPSPGRLSVINNSLGELIRWAYRLKEHQLEGPSWIEYDSVSFDIEARTAPEATKAQMRVMLQSLLQSRF